MNGWDYAVLELEQTGTVKECPFCKSKKVKACKVERETRDCYWFKCEDCGQSSHYGGALKGRRNG